MTIDDPSDSAYGPFGPADRAFVPTNEPNVEAQRMKLDLLYEIDVPKPWAKPHPYGQREAEQRAYREALEQIKLGDKLGFHTTWHVEHHFREGRSHSPAPEVVIGALSQCTEPIRLGCGLSLMPPPFPPPMRVAEKVATADILSGGRV